jgi:hypothetical protein
MHDSGAVIGLRSRQRYEGSSRRKLDAFARTVVMRVSIVVGTFSTLGLWVKTLDLCGLDNSGADRRYPLECVGVELQISQPCSDVFDGNLLFFLCISFYL